MPAEVESFEADVSEKEIVGGEHRRRGTRRTDQQKNGLQVGIIIGKTQRQVKGRLETRADK